MPVRTNVLSMVSSFRMQAVMTTLKGLPALCRRSANARKRSLHRLAVSAAMYSVARRAPRPPRMRRCPRNAPLSWLNGARPARLAICCRLSRPSSGSSATSVAPVVGPTPGTLWTRSKSVVPGFVPSGLRVPSRPQRQLPKRPSLRVLTIRYGASASRASVGGCASSVQETEPCNSSATAATCSATRRRTGNSRPRRSCSRASSSSQASACTKPSNSCNTSAPRAAAATRSA